MMDRLYAFLLGVCEFKQDITSGFDGDEEGERGCALQHAYEAGREWAHRLTLRAFEPM
jgi:hypothetical protein